MTTSTPTWILDSHKRRLKAMGYTDEEIGKMNATDALAIFAEFDAPTISDPPPTPVVTTNGNGHHEPGRITPPTKVSMREHALRYAALGLYVVPLHNPLTKPGWSCSCEGYKRSQKYKKWLTEQGKGNKFDPEFTCRTPGKHPRVKNWEELASTDPAQINKWWQRWSGANIGIAAGKSGLLDVEMDSYKDNFGGENLLTPDEQETTTILSGGGGEHGVYLMPEGKQYGNETGDLPEGIDIRGYGGLFVAPPSMHPSGRRYEWEHDRSPWDRAPAPLPEKIVAILDAAQESGGDPVEFTEVTTKRPELSDLWLLSDSAKEKIKNVAPVGKRSNADMSVCVSMLYAGATPDDILAVFEHYPIGTQGKFAEKGRDYLARTIRAARKYVADHPREGARSPEETAAIVDFMIKNLRAILDHNSKLSDDKRRWPDAVVIDWVRSFGKELYSLSPEQLESIKAALLDLGQSQEWIDKDLPKLIKRAYLRTLPLSQQIEGDLEEWSYQFWLNDMDDSLWNGDQRIDDPERATLRMKARNAGYGGKGNPKTLGALEDTCIMVAAKNRRHPVREWLNSLKWDGQDHIANLAGYFIEAPDENGNPAVITYQDGTTRTAFHAFLRRWLIGAVAKQMGDANAVRNNFILVFTGPQGSGKSHFANWICPLPDYFVEKHIQPENKDCALLRTRTFVWEVMEIGATTRKTDVEALKGFVTGTVTTERKAYGHFDTVKPSVASYIGTINPDGAGFLSDTTGNRRFNVVNLLCIDWTYSTAIDPAQVWAQAVALWRKDSRSYRLTAEETQVRDENAAAHMESDLLADMIRRVFTVQPDNSDPGWRISSSELLEALRAYGGLSRGNDRVQGKDLAKSLKSQWGIVGKRSHGATYYSGLKHRGKLAGLGELLAEDSLKADGL
jgi:hypothetical protein